MWCDNNSTGSPPKMQQIHPHTRCSSTVTHPPSPLPVPASPAANKQPTHNGRCSISRSARQQEPNKRYLTMPPPLHLNPGSAQKSTSCPVSRSFSSVEFSCHPTVRARKRKSCSSIPAKKNLLRSMWKKGKDEREHIFLMRRSESFSRTR